MDNVKDADGWFFLVFFGRWLGGVCVENWKILFQSKNKHIILLPTRFCFCFCYIFKVWMLWQMKPSQESFSPLRDPWIHSRLDKTGNAKTQWWEYAQCVPGWIRSQHGWGDMSKDTSDGRDSSWRSASPPPSRRQQSREKGYITASLAESRAWLCLSWALYSWSSCSTLPASVSCTLVEGR